jgi:protein SCO1/2
MKMDEHMHHHHHDMGKVETKRSEMNYVLPKVKLVRTDGTSVLLEDELNDGKVTVLNFIYTTCTAICPMTTQIFFKLQGKLGKDLDKVHLVSISIDPEQDTPAQLKKFAEKYRASKFWQFYTGTVEASVAVQKAFEVYRGDKMNHAPVTFIRAAAGKPWVRMDGFSSADELLHEVQGAIESTAK